MCRHDALRRGETERLQGCRKCQRVESIMCEDVARDRDESMEAEGVSGDGALQGHVSMRGNKMAVERAEKCRDSPTSRAVRVAGRQRHVCIRNVWYLPTKRRGMGS